MTVTEISWSERFAQRTRGESDGALAAILALSGRTDIISFAGGLPDPQTMPGTALSDLVAEIAADPATVQYSPVRGLRGTLAYVAQRLARNEGRAPAEDELMITSGCIEALELLGKAFLDRGDTVLVEAPTYMGAFMGFQSFEAVPLTIPMDDDGLLVDRAEIAMAASPTPKFLYTVADFQNPTGITLSRERRQHLVEAARRHGVLIVEDVTYRELGFAGDPLPSLWSLAPDVVVQIGTFSKTFFPGVRLGWAVGPAEVIDQMVLAKQNTDQCAGALGQRMVEAWGRSGRLDAQIAHARPFYGRRRDLILDALRRHMPPGVTWTEPRGGFVTWLTLPATIDTTDLAERAMDEHVAFVPGPVFYPHGSAGRNNLRLSYSGVQDDVIDEGIRRLGNLLQSAGVGD